MRHALLALLLLVRSPALALPPPADWVPVRWPWSDPASLELLAGTPVNCLLLKTYPADLVAAAAKASLVTLALVTPGDDPAAATRRALASGLTGVVLEGNFPADAAAQARRAAGTAPVVELMARRQLPLRPTAAVIGTYQGVWPGISIEEDGTKKAGPTGTTWIDTNTGFIRTARAFSDAAFWMANVPPPKTIITTARYLQVIADAAVSGARWVLAFDDDFAARLRLRHAAALRDWARIGEMLRYFEQHPEWRRLRPYGTLALVEAPDRGGLLSGGVLDMLAANHIPARPVPPEALSPGALHDITLALNLGSGSLSDAQEKILRAFADSGGKVFAAPPLWNDRMAGGDRFTLSTEEFERLNRIWNQLDPTLPRRSLAVRLFNVSSMLSHVLVSDGGKTLLVHLVNYSDYPVENVSLMFPSAYSKATLLAPDTQSQNLQVFPNNGASGVTLEKVSICVTVRLDQ